MRNKSWLTHFISLQLNDLDPVGVHACQGRGSYNGRHEEWRIQGRLYFFKHLYHTDLYPNLNVY